MKKYVRTWAFPVLLMSVRLLALVSRSLAQTGQVLTGSAAFTDWKADAPGVRRHIKPADVPALLRVSTKIS